MFNNKIDAEVQVKTSKSGNTYYVIYLKDIEKQVFLEKAEVLLLKKLGKISEK